MAIGEMQCLDAHGPFLFTAKNNTRACAIFKRKMDTHIASSQAGLIAICDADTNINIRIDGPGIGECVACHGCDGIKIDAAVFRGISIGYMAEAAIKENIKFAPVK